nr:ARID DNA-binding domain-containing protein [Tanacetum cinerariifolium]
MWAGLDIDSDQDTYSGNKDTRQLTVNSFKGFIRFMKLANNNKVVLKHRENFTECFESMIKWFHNTYIKGDVTKLMPLMIDRYEICLFDLYKLVKCFGGYERLNYKKKWDEEMKNYNLRKRLYRRPHVNSDTKALGWQRIRNYNNQLDDNFLEGLKNLSLNPRTTRNRRIPRKRCFVCRNKGHTRQNCPSKQVANDPMDKTLMANDQVKMDADYVQLHYDTIGLKGDFLVEGMDKENWNKICVSFVPEIGINVLSLHQLACQGFELQVNGTTCVIRRMFEEANEEMTTEEVLEIQNAYLEKYFQEFITSTTNEGRDSADTNLIKQEVEIPLKSSEGKRLNNDEGNSDALWFIRFMKLANNNKVVLKHRENFTKCFESMIKWFHNTYIKGDVTKLMPLTIGRYEICVFDLYKLVKCFGGYERLNYKKKWDEVSLGFGFSGLYGFKFKEIYVHYLLIPETYFEAAKVGLT